MINCPLRLIENHANSSTLANIGWRTFIIFAVLNAAFIPMVYCFYPETKGLELEDIPLLFAKGGFTGGVFTSRGKTVIPHQHAQEALDRKAEGSVMGELEDPNPEPKV